MPRLPATEEHRLWFSDLVFTRNGNSIVFSPGMAGLLTVRAKESNTGPDFDSLKAECDHLTRHWSPLARLERFGILILLGLLFVLPLLAAQAGFRFDLFDWVIEPIVRVLIRFVLGATGLV